jgi:hypothetical protein
MEWGGVSDWHSMAFWLSGVACELSRYIGFFRVDMEQ